jgi:hypothetical protein
VAPHRQKVERRQSRGLPARLNAAQLRSARATGSVDIALLLLGGVLELLLMLLLGGVLELLLMLLLG